VLRSGDKRRAGDNAPATSVNLLVLEIHLALPS